MHQPHIALIINTKGFLKKHHPKEMYFANTNKTTIFATEI